MTDSANPTVSHNADKNRFEAQTTGGLARLDYMEVPGRIVMTHTEVPEEAEGEGVGSALAKAALEYARKEERAVVPLCPFVASYIRRHDEYRSLVLDGFKL